MAKARGRKPSAKKAAKGRKAVKSSLKSLQDKLKQIENMKAEAQAQYEEEKKQVLLQAIESKKADVAKATEAVKKAQVDLDRIEKELHGLLVEAGLARGARKGRRVKKGAKGGRKKGRKARVSRETKKQYVKEALGKFPKGAAYSEFRDYLLTLTDPSTGGSIFATTDFNSSAKFGAEYLPRGWKVKGERRNAMVLPN